MNLRTLRGRWDILAAFAFSAAFLAVLMFIALKTAGDIRGAADQINKGQRAIVCILAVDPQERTKADVIQCIRESGLGQ